MTDARAWLPESALTAMAVGAALAAPIVAWSQRWFASAQATVLRVRPHAGAMVSPLPQGFQIEGTHTVIDVPGSGKRLLVEAALDLDLKDESRNADDIYLLEAFAKEVASDLARELDAVMASDGKAGHDITTAVTLAFGEDDLLDVTTAETNLIALLKKGLAPPSPSAKPLHLRSRVVGNTKIVTRASLGKAELSLADLVALSEGDVLVLDRELTEPAELCVAGVDKPFARGLLRKHAGRLSVHL